ncbi:TCOF protein, partial [Chunga burmeisteri]|nr:TCOF protein [Chunga burmeisteri]
MAADGRGGRELLALIHQHLLRGGYARAARELQAQIGQKLLPSLSTSLEDIFTHWEKTPSNSRRRKVSDEETAIPEKIRVPDPVSSSESSEKEEDEKEKAKAANASSLSLASNSGVNVESSEDDDSSSEEETPAGKGAITVTPAVVTGKAANSLRSPNKSTAPAGKAAVLSTANRTVVSNKQQPNAPAASATPAKAGQKLLSPRKPGHAATAAAKISQNKTPVTTKAPESSSSSSSSSSESEEEKETPTVKASAPKVELKQAAGAAESSSEESSDETSEEEELATPAVQAKPAVKTVQVNAAPVKSPPAAPASLKKNAMRQTALAPNQAKTTSTTVPGAAKPDDTSESSDSSDSEDEELPKVTQMHLSETAKPPPKSSQAVPSPVKPTPAVSLSGKATPAKTLPLSQGKPSPKPAVPKQAKTTLGRTAAPTKPAESTKPVESSESSGSEEEDLPVPVSQKRLVEQPGPVPNLSQAAKAGPPEKAVGNTLKSQASESGSSDSSDSEEESPVAQPQPLQAVKTNAVPQPTNVKKAPAPAPQPVDSSDDSSEESDSEEEIVPPSQASTPLCLKQTIPVGKTPPANTAAPQAASLLGSPTAKSRKPGLQPAQDARLSQATPPSRAEETSDSSSSLESNKEETPKQPPKPAGSLQKPGGTQPAHSSSSESSEEEEEEEAASQSLLTGYLGLCKTPAAPQTPKTVPPQPVGKVGQGKAAVTAANSLTKAPVKADPADSSSSDSSDSDTDVDHAAANHKAENNPSPGQEATGASNKEKVVGKTEPGPVSLKPSPLKKTLAVKENDVEAKRVQVTPAFSIPQSEESSSGSETEVTTAAKVPAVQTLEGLEVKKKKKKEKKEKKEKKKPSSTADKAAKTPKSKDKENKKQKTSQKRKLPGDDGAIGQPKEKRQKGQTNEEVPKKKKKKAT